MLSDAKYVYYAFRIRVHMKTKDSISQETVSRFLIYFKFMPYVITLRKMIDPLTVIMKNAVLM